MFSHDFCPLMGPWLVINHCHCHKRTVVIRCVLFIPATVPLFAKQAVVERVSSSHFSDRAFKACDWHRHATDTFPYCVLPAPTDWFVENAQAGVMLSSLETGVFFFFFFFFFFLLLFDHFFFFHFKLFVTNIKHPLTVFCEKTTSGHKKNSTEISVCASKRLFLSTCH